MFTAASALRFVNHPCFFLFPYSRTSDTYSSTTASAPLHLRATHFLPLIALC